MSRFVRRHPEEIRIRPRSTDLSLDSVKTASHDATQILQLERLKHSLAHTYGDVPAYRAKFDAASVHPSGLRSLAGLARFSFTTKTGLRDNHPFGTFVAPQDRIAHTHASSGTTGGPMIVGYTLADIDTWTDLVARSIRTVGARHNDKAHVSYGHRLFTDGPRAHYGMERMGPTAISFGGGQTERQVQLISNFQSQIVMTTPSYVLAIIDEFERQEIDPVASNLQIDTFDTGPWTPEICSIIEAYMGLSAVDVYGLPEVVRPDIASECTETRDGPTIWGDHFYPEIVDPETSEVLPDSEFGELISASLTKKTMPVVRYYTHDLTRPLPDIAHPGFRRMEKITRHCDDTMIMRDVNVFPSRIEELIPEHAAPSPYYQCMLGKEGPLGTLAVRIGVTLGVPTDATQSASNQLAHGIKSLIDTIATVKTFASGGIERSVGKARRMVDLRRGWPVSVLVGGDADTAVPRNEHPQAPRLLYASGQVASSITIAKVIVDSYGTVNG